MKKLSKLVALISAGMIIASANMAFAQIYTDVPDSHWASTYIASMNRLGVIKGYEDATFRPNESITREQAMVMISRILKPSDSEKNAALSKHKTYLNSLGAASWAQKDIAYAIEKKILTKNDVKKFYYNKRATVITREELCIYLTRMMGKESDAQNASIIVMSFIDQELISDAALKYVYVIQNLGIVQGTPDNKFSPKGAVTRAAMAKMLDLSYKEVSNTGSTNETPKENTQISSEEKSIEGSIETILQSGSNQIHAYVKKDNGKRELIKIEKDTDIKMGSKKINYDDIKEGYDVELDYKVIGSENIATKVRLEAAEKDLVGTIYNLRRNDITIETEDEKETYSLDEDAKIEIDGEKSRISKLDEDQRGVFKIQNGEIKEIRVINKNRTLEGIIKEINYKKEEIVVEDKDENKYEYDINVDDVVIEKDDDDANFDDLHEGDEVEITLRYDEVTDIEADTVERNLEGYISAISIDGENSKIEIKDKKGDEYELIVDKKTDIELDSEDAELYDLRIGYVAEVEYSGNKAIEIDAEIKFKEDKIEGQVYRIYEDDDYIKVYLNDGKDYKDEDDRKVIKVRVENKTKIIRGDDEIKLKNIDRDDEIIIIGNYLEDDDEFGAKSIIVIEY